MPANSIMAITQDRAGYLWLGTSDGLVRFDGYGFDLFNKANVAAFNDQLIMSLYADHRGRLWCGSYRGDLIKLEGGKFSRQTLALPGSSRSINAIAEDANGNLWLGMADGLICRPAGMADRHTEVSAFRGEKINCFSEDVDGRVWLGTNNGELFMLQGGRWRRFALPGTGFHKAIVAICWARDGRLLLGTDDGIFVFKDQKLEHIALGSGLSDNVICFKEDRDLNLWVGTENGLYRIARGQMQKLTQAHGLASSIVYSLCEDDEGSLWVGMIDGGLGQLRDEKVSTFGGPEGLASGLVRCIRGTPGGKLWIGGHGGFLSDFESGRFENFRLPTWLLGKCIWSIEADPPAALWLGTDFGLIHFQNGRFRPISLPGTAAHIEIRCVLKDRSGRLWIGTYGEGLFCLQRGASKRFAGPEGLRDSRITALFEDRRGNLWVGCESGLAVMPPGSAGIFTMEPSLSDCHVVSFYGDKRGSMWVGTHSQGLKIYEDGRWGSLGSDRGLFDNRVYAILEDDLGYLWLSSERGIFQAGREELAKAAFDKKLKVSGRLFDESDGMKSRICNNGSPAAWRESGSRLWFANLAGVVSVDPTRIRKSDRVPPVLVEEVIVDHHSLPTPGDSRELPSQLAAGSKRFEFTYTALSLIRSDKIEFKYKLEGYDRDWTAAGSRRQAFYNDLWPGRYRFRVLAANADGVWNTSGASFAFALRPFIYQTWWFLALAALAFSALSVLLWQLLKKYLRAVTFWKKKTQIGHFKILETIGSGGMATVYKAQDLLSRKRVVALKVLNPENFSDEAQRKRFKHEALITERLEHPHIVRIIERGEMEDCWYIAMELLQGISLARLIREKGRLPLADALEIMVQVVDALQAIHALEIVHRDLKPENIMISEGDGRRPFVKLLDFGLAITPAQSRLTMSGVVMGTVRYLPPERIHDGVSSAAGDIYSAGIILYEMLTAAKPFWSEATGEVIHRILETYPMPVREIDAAIPAELDALIASMIDKKPERRPSLETIQAVLRRLGATQPSARQEGQ